MASITTSPTRSLFYLFFLCFFYFQHSLLPFTLSVFWEDGCLAVERDRSSSATSRTRCPATFASMDRPSGGISLVGLMSSRGHTERRQRRSCYREKLCCRAGLKFCVLCAFDPVPWFDPWYTHVDTKERCLRTCRRSKQVPGPSLRYLQDFRPLHRVLVIRLRSRLTYPGIHVHVCNIILCKF